MPSIGAAYQVVSHAQDMSGGTADVKSLTVPTTANGFELTATTTSAYVSVDGTDPSSASHAQIIVAGSTPILFPYVPASRAALKFASTAAGNSTVRVTWLA